MRKNKRRYFIMLVILIMLALIIALLPTLSKYVTTANGESSINIARWEIKVNSQSIRQNKDISGVITPVFPGTQHIANDVIAPSSEGYFDLIINFTDADVSCDYVITFQTLNSNVTDLIVTSYKAPDGTTITVSDASTRNNVDIHGTYNYGNTATNNLVQNYRINVMWNDNPTTESMNNTQDTNATVPTNTTDEYATTKMNVQIAFTQKVS